MLFLCLQVINLVDSLVSDTDDDDDEEGQNYDLDDDDESDELYEGVIIDDLGDVDIGDLDDEEEEEDEDEDHIYVDDEDLERNGLKVQYVKGKKVFEGKLLGCLYCLLY